MKNIFRRIAGWKRRIAGWKNGVVSDGVFTLSEAIVVLFISFLPLIIRSINYAFHTRGVNFIDAFLISVESTIHPTEVIVYITAILSSSIAYFLFRTMF